MRCIPCTTALHYNLYAAAPARQPYITTCTLQPVRYIPHATARTLQCLRYNLYYSPPLLQPCTIALRYSPLCLASAPSTFSFCREPSSVQVLSEAQKQKLYNHRCSRTTNLDSYKCLHRGLFPTITTSGTAFSGMFLIIDFTTKLIFDDFRWMLASP